MRQAHTLFSFMLAACTAAAVPAWAQAQAIQPIATDPTAATAPVHRQSLLESGSLETAQTDWLKANDAVAEFPRGHVDILKWEAAQSRPASASAPVQPVPPGNHSHSPAQRPGGQP